MTVVDIDIKSKCLIELDVLNDVGILDGLRIILKDSSYATEGSFIVTIHLITR